ncbi:bifunctional DNA primase/polymerase [Methyloceanibacter caenitepidi]|uniref:DNA primase/helicase, phage-associated n=1 Tax=Methyloceanibacter caenitepidi TaxID=1384459 RepID=A0A0A8K0P8_9HYPH|nr:bifunctional DNA primase/polymerase [Methyloceanibacter caenitepidi]BAQ16082.1 DNA primase/helicase, phage-associated [Methyloceanibacter caenitepidi]
MKNKHDWARALARQGLRVFPLQPNGKRPAIEGWQREATSDAEKINSWWRGEFADSNIGIATGSGLLVIDADCKGGRPGLPSLDMLDMEGLPESFRVRTPSGGLHVYLTYDPANEIRGGADCLEGYPGIDIRAEGGLVVGPGSTIDGAAYDIL